MTMNMDNPSLTCTIGCQIHLVDFPIAAMVEVQSRVKFQNSKGAAK
jgi:hypothetical protein